MESSTGLEEREGRDGGEKVGRKLCGKINGWILIYTLELLFYFLFFLDKRGTHLSTCVAQTICSKVLVPRVFEL